MSEQTSDERAAKKFDPFVGYFIGFVVSLLVFSFLFNVAFVKVTLPEAALNAGIFSGLILSALFIAGTLVGMSQTSGKSSPAEDITKSTPESNQ